MKHTAQISASLECSAWEARRAEVLHAACRAVADAVSAGAQVTKALKVIARSYRGTALGNGRFLRLALPTMLRNYYVWVKNRCPDVFYRPNRPARKAIDRAKLQLAIASSVANRATALEVFQFYRQFDPNLNVGNETLRRALGKSGIQCLAKIRSLRQSARMAKRRYYAALRDHERALDRLTDERAKLGIPPRTVQVLINGVLCVCTARGELLAAERSDGSRPTIRQRRYIAEIFNEWRKQRNGGQHAK